MAFRLATKREVTWPVKVNVPVDDGDTVESQFSVRFELLDQDEFNSLSESDDVAFFTRVVIGFGADVQAENGDSLPFTPKNLQCLLNIPFVRVGLYQAYTEAVSGIAVKNSKGRHVTGRTGRKSPSKK